MKFIQVDIETKCFPQSKSVGTLGYDRIRGNAAYQWEYDALWLLQHRQMMLSGDLQNVGGPQYSSERLFGFLQDAMPDRWGRRLIDKRERLFGYRGCDYWKWRLCRSAGRVGTIIPSCGVLDSHP